MPLLAAPEKRTLRTDIVARFADCLHAALNVDKHAELAAEKLATRVSLAAASPLATKVARRRLQPVARNRQQFRWTVLPVARIVRLTQSLLPLLCSKLSAVSC